MSRIFELLNKSSGEVADLVRPLVDEQTRGTARSNGESQGSEVSSLASVRTLSLRIPAPSPLLPFEGGQWQTDEQYRILRTKISQFPTQPRVIAISSPAPGDGKSVTAINTAGALALKSEAAVLLVDADLRKPTLHEQLGLPQSPGLADVLAGACALEDAMVHTKEFHSLYTMSSGTTSANLVELLDSKQWRTVCTKLRGMFRYVIIDSPPVAAVADYALIQDVCDGVILVVRPYWTNRNLCRQALDLVPKAKFLGVLLNRVAAAKQLGEALAE